jgi:hypothetical protein
MLERGLVRRSLLRRSLVPQHLLEPRAAEAAGPSVGTDGPGGVFVPASPADFTALAIAPPTHLWLCQEASGSLAPSVGDITLAPDGTTADLSYDNAVTGWTRKFLGLTGASSNRWTTTDASLDIPLNGSVAMLLYAAANNTGATRGIGSLGNDEFAIALTAGGAAQCRGTGGNGSGSVESFDNLTTVHPLLYVRDCVADVTRIYTDAEQVNATHTDDAASAGLDKGIGFPGGQAAEALVGLCAIWFGAAAEGLGKEVLSKLGWSVAY